jgi:choline/glycine/proline betaine transport protein
VITVFFVTSSDSGSFVIDMIASGGSLNPPVGLRVFWALTEGAVAATLVLAGGLVALQAAAIATGLPFTIVLIIVMLGIFKGLRSERDGVTLEEVAAGPLFEGEDETEVREHQPTAARRPEAEGHADPETQRPER